MCRACRLTCIHTLELPEALRPIANTSRSARRAGGCLGSPLQASRPCAALLHMRAAHLGLTSIGSRGSMAGASMEADAGSGRWRSRARRTGFCI